MEQYKVTLDKDEMHLLIEALDVYFWNDKEFRDEAQELEDKLWAILKVREDQ